MPAVRTTRARGGDDVGGDGVDDEVEQPDGVGAGIGGDGDEEQSGGVGAEKK